MAQQIDEQTTSPPESNQRYKPTPLGSYSSGSGGSIDVNNLGYYLDGWADLVENKGDQSKAVYESTAEILKERYPPKTVRRHTISTKSIQRNTLRPYAITTNRPGATTAIYINDRGSDLYVSWRTYIKPVLNQNLLLLLGGMTLVISFLLGARDGVTSVVIIFLFLALLLLAGVAITGRLMKGDNAYYFFLQPTVYDAEDITAMSMAAHKSIHRALDKEGVDVSQLRLKQDFIGGRRDETI